MIEKRADGRFNYEFPPPPERERKSSSSDSEEEDPPYVDVTVRLRGGEIVVRADGAETLYREVRVDVRVDTLDKPVVYGLTLEDPQ